MLTKIYNNQHCTTPQLSLSGSVLSLMQKTIFMKSCSTLVFLKHQKIWDS